MDLIWGKVKLKSREEGAHCIHCRIAGIDKHVVAGVELQNLRVRSSLSEPCTLRALFRDGFLGDPTGLIPARGVRRQPTETAVDAFHRAYREQGRVHSPGLMRTRTHLVSQR